MHLPKLMSFKSYRDLAVTMFLVWMTVSCVLLEASARPTQRRTDMSIQQTGLTNSADSQLASYSLGHVTLHRQLRHAVRHARMKELRRLWLESMNRESRVRVSSHNTLRRERILTSHRDSNRQAIEAIQPS